MKRQTRSRETFRSRRLPSGLREVFIIGPDLRDPAVRARIAEQIRRLNPKDEEESMLWIEAVSQADPDDGGSVA